MPSFQAGYNAWSASGGSRDSSFRHRAPDKEARAKQIRSDCLTSHLVTPAFKGRSLVLETATPPPQGSQTIGFRPRQLNSEAGGSIKKDPDAGSFKVSSNRKKTLDSLSMMAIGKK